LASRFCGLWLLACFGGLVGEGFGAGGLLELRFPATEAELAGEVAAAFSIGRARLVSVVLPGHKAVAAVRADGGGEVELLAHDGISRLAILDGAVVKAPNFELGTSGSLRAGDAVRVAGAAQARVTGWTRRHGGRVLPVSLLRVNYPASPPSAGTPLLDGKGRVVAIGYQTDPVAESVGYALPVEVVARVLADYERDRRVVRTWLGVTLREGDASPSLVRIEPGSPAERGGLLAGDVLLQIGSRSVNGYAEAVNAFYYLVAGRQTPVRVLRGVKVVDVMVVPQAVASGVGASAGS
jgi:serine protease Do